MNFTKEELSLMLTIVCEEAKRYGNRGKTPPKEVYDLRYKINDLLKNKDIDCSEEINYDNWSNAEIANALVSNDEFLNENVKEGNEDDVINWDRCDLISYAYDYLT